MRATGIIHPLKIVQPNSDAVLLNVHDIDQIGGGKKYPEKANPRGNNRGDFCSSRQATLISKPSP
jgi:hypothetical protein